MDYSHRFRTYPSETGNEEACERHRNLHRQLYNHALHEYDAASEGDKPTKYDQKSG